MKAEKEGLRTWLFKQSGIYQKVEKLSKQKVTSKKELTVLTNHEQKVLKEVVMELYADYISDTQTQYPLLTDEDLLYLCLEKAGFSYQTIALCFGNTTTHVVAQRKYRIKERMNESKQPNCDLSKSHNTVNLHITFLQCDSFYTSIPSLSSNFAAVKPIKIKRNESKVIYVTFSNTIHFTSE